jgi:hypothetical protein
MLAGAPVAQWYNTRLRISRSRVQIPPNLHSENEKI